MCCKGNQTVFKSCRAALLKQANVKAMSNREMRWRLAKLGGCANVSPVILTKADSYVRVNSVGGDSQ